MDAKKQLRKELDALTREMLNTIHQLQETNKVQLMDTGGLDLMKKKIGVGDREHKGILGRIRKKTPKHN